MKRRDGLIIDISDEEVTELLDRYRRDAGEDGGPVSRSEAVSQIVAESLRSRFGVSQVRR